MASYHVLTPIHPYDPNFPQPVTSLAFDSNSDVIWAGSGSGILSAYSGSHMRTVYFPVGGHVPVKKIVSSESEVRAIGDAGIGSWRKGGANSWYLKDGPLNTFCLHPTLSHSLLVAKGGDNSQFQLVNTYNGTVTREVSSPSMITHLQPSHTLVLSGSSDGNLRTHDFRTTGRKDDGGIEGLVLAHVGGVQGLQVSGNYAFTIGWGLRQSRPFLDPLVKIFDLRTLRPVGPLPFPSGPAMINIHPNKSSVVVAISAAGLVNIADVGDLNSGGEFIQLNIGSYLTTSAISPTGTYLAFGDADGFIHLATTAYDETHVPFNGFDGKPVPWPDTLAPLPDIEWDDSTPLNTIGMPHYSSRLLSAYTADLVPASAGVPVPRKIHPEVLSTMKMTAFVGYAQTPTDLKGKRNVVLPEAGTIEKGRFRSDQSKSKRIATEEEEESLESGIPRSYRKVEIKYSKFGVEDFDFGYYNRTSYSGLETHILNSYTNSLIQLLHYTLPVRQIAKSHITTDCRKEFCLLCELGFVTRMLEDAHGINCQASNFCKTIGKMSQASALGLVDYESDGAVRDYATMIQQFNRFLLDQFAVEGDMHEKNPQVVPLTQEDPTVTPDPPPPIAQLLGITAKSVIVCGVCQAVRVKPSMSHVVDLVYPRKVDGQSDVDFSKVLLDSIIRDTSYKATCQTCKQLSTFRSSRVISPSQLPPIMAVNANVNNPDHLQRWASSNKQRFLHPTTEIQLPTQPTDGEDDPTDTSVEVVKYKLRGIVAEIRAGKANHLVAIIRVPEAETEGGGSPWFVLNDFMVRNVSEDEALSFSGKWKVPCVLFLEREDPDPQLDFSGLPLVASRSILQRRITIAPNLNHAALKHQALTADEMPKPGTLVAIDAEFVSLQLEESEIRSDGTKKVLRPSILSLARVSVLRGNGPSAGKPFIDDYIHTSDVIVDYLTEYSGIRFGDLDPNFSTRILLPLKAVYKKLRLLIDLGCIFVGHGVTKDFRIINIFVPPEQVMDTVDIYFIKDRQRRLSLRFLSWYVLKEQIQSDSHDSIEDARAALLLYKEYLRLEGDHAWDEYLDELYREGRKVNWKVPPSETTANPTPQPQPQPPPPAVPPIQDPFGFQSHIMYSTHMPQLQQMQQMQQQQQPQQMLRSPPHAGTARFNPTGPRSGLSQYHQQAQFQPGGNVQNMWRNNQYK